MMKPKQLCTEDRAVSPVVGVIVLVSISIVLAAVTGLFVLEFGGNLDQNAPQAGFEFDYQDQAVTIAHVGGDSVEASRLNVTGSASGEYGLAVSEGASVDAGTVVVDDQAYDPDETIRVIWESDGGESSAILNASTAPA